MPTDEALLQAPRAARRDDRGAAGESGTLRAYAGRRPLRMSSYRVASERILRPRLVRARSPRTRARRPQSAVAPRIGMDAVTGRCLARRRRRRRRGSFPPGPRRRGGAPRNFPTAWPKKMLTLDG